MNHTQCVFLEESFTWPVCITPRSRLRHFFVFKNAVSQAEGWDAFRTAWISVLSCPQPNKFQKGWQKPLSYQLLWVQDPKQVKSLPLWCLSQRVKGLSIYANRNESNVDKDWLESHTRNSTNDVLFGLCFVLPKKFNFCWNFGVT